MSNNGTWKRALLPALCALLTFACLPASASTARLTPTVKAVNRALPCVVSIGTEKEINKRDPYYTRLNDYFGIYRYRIKRTREYSPLGSGIIVHPAGYVLTNWHVVRAAESNVIIRLLNGDSYLGSIIGFDRQCDLCLLKIDTKGKKLHQAAFARPDDLMLGETVITLGNPFGLEHSVSQGVLSATNRNLDVTGESYDDIIQTDASINPGNSGGPLINLDGEVIGLNQAIRSDAQGIGFAIPVRRLLMFVSRWMLPEVISDVTAFVRFSQNVSGISLEVAPGTPPAAAGLKTGDFVDTVNGIPVGNVIDASIVLAGVKDKEDVRIVLNTGKEHVFKAARMSDERLIAFRMGMKVQKLTKAMNAALDLPPDLKGLAVNQMMPPETYRAGNPAENDFTQGSLIFAVDDVPVPDVRTLAGILRGKKSGDVVVLSCALSVRGFYRRFNYRFMLM